MPKVVPITRIENKNVHNGSAIEYSFLQTIIQAAMITPMLYIKSPITWIAAALTLILSYFFFSSS